MRQADLKKLNRLHSRHGRRKCGLILCEGVRGCREALRHRSEWLHFMVLDHSVASGEELLELRRLAELSGRTVYLVPHDRFRELAATENPQGVLCVLQRPAEEGGFRVGPCSDPFVLVLDRLSDPGNFGAIARTAWAAGLRELWITAGTVDPYIPKCIRAGMGAQFVLRIRQFADLSAAAEEMSQQGFNFLWRSAPSGGVGCYSDSFNLSRSGLVLGNEAHGAGFSSSHPIDTCDVSIPMPGAAESLNVAQAAAILIFEGVRRGLRLS